MDQDSSPLPLLLASTLIELPGNRTSRQLGKVATSSLLRYFFNGDIVLWRNFPEPLYPVARVGLYEIESSLDSLPCKKKNLQRYFSQTRHNMALSLSEQSSKYSWVIFATPGVLALRNWDHLFEDQGAEVMISTDSEGLPEDSFFAIRGNIYPRFLNQWKQVHRDPVRAAKLVASILKNEPFRVSKFERGEVVKPFQESIGVRDIMKAAVVDLSGGTPEEQTKLGFALHMMGTFGDKDGVFLDLMES